MAFRIQEIPHSVFQWKCLAIGAWNKNETRRSFFDWAFRELQLKSLDDWYSIKSEKIVNLGGKKLLSQFKDRLNDALKDSYPEHVWLPWKFGSKRNGFWQNRENLTEFLKWSEVQLGIVQMEDWYKINASNVRSLGGGEFLAQFDGSLVKSLQNLRPEFDWQVWKFEKVPQGFWKDEENHIKMVYGLAKEFGIKLKDDWYSITVSKVESKGGRLLLEYYGQSLVNLLKFVYPEHPWQIWRFHQVSAGFWDDISNQKMYFDWLAEQLNINDLQDWYNIKEDQWRDKDKLRFLLSSKYGDSLAKALKTIYPHYPWKLQRIQLGLKRSVHFVQHSLIRVVSWLPILQNIQLRKQTS